MSDFLKFSEIIEAIEGSITQSGSFTDRVKSIANMVYLTEIVEADDLYPLFWLVKMDDSLNTLSPMTITGATQANPCVLTASNSLRAGDIITVYTIEGMAELNNRSYQVGTSGQGLTTAAIPLLTPEGTTVDASGFTAYTSGGTISHRGLKLATTGIDVQSVLSAAFHGFQPMSEIDDEELEETTTWWDNSTSRPTRYQHRKFYDSSGVETNQLWLFPGCDDAYDLRHYVKTRVPRLVGDNDVPLLPPQFHDSIISGSITRLVDSMVQVENAVIWPGLYAQQLKSLTSFNRKYYEKHRTPPDLYLL